jgi:hypothetical protein
MIPFSERSRSIILGTLLVALPICFLVGAVTHTGVQIPLGVTTLDEPTIVPAAIVESVIAAAFTVAAFARFSGRPYARIALRIALRVGIAGVLLGMAALALGRGTRTELNDVFHVVALIAMLFAWELTSRSAAGGACWSRRSGMTRRAT